MTNRIYLISAALILTGCSSAAQGAPNTAVVTQGGPDVVAAFNDAPPVSAPELDGAPPMVAPPVAPPSALRAPDPAPPAVAEKVQARFSCDIDVDRTPNGIRVTPVVRAHKALSGEYSLVITKSGASGSSDISQGGPFDAARGERVRLGASEFSMEWGARFRAVLKVRAGGREICRDISS